MLSAGTLPFTGLDIVWFMIPGLEATPPASRRTAARQAAAFRAGLRPGDAFGRIVIPRLGLRMVIVEGTRESDLARGPGHYRITSLPGRGGTVAIAGRRTTYLQPFRHVDELRRGDEIRTVMPLRLVSIRRLRPRDRR